MENREKQIEETAIRLSDIADNKDIMITPNPYSLVGWSKIAKELLKHRQIVDKDSVIVLSREEFENNYVTVQMYELAKAFHDEKCAEFEKLCYDYNKLKNQLDQASKEKSEKIFKRVFEEFSIFNDKEEILIYQIRDILKYVAKQFGVEIN